MALVICRILHFAFLCSVILCNCQRFDFRVQRIDGSVLDYRFDWMRMELVGRVHALCGIIWSIEARGFGPTTRKLRRLYLIAFHARRLFNFVSLFVFRWAQWHRCTHQQTHRWPDHVQPRHTPHRPSIRRGGNNMDQNDNRNHYHVEHILWIIWTL